MQRVVIIDYGSGNLHSAAKAFERAARESEANTEIIVSSAVSDLALADRVVLPGVGAYGDCKRGLDAVPGLLATLDDVVRKKARPFLGICVGMQLMSERGREFEVTEGLGWIKGEVRAIEPNDKALKIPHMGWNTISNLQQPLFADVNEHSSVYFVHGYYVETSDESTAMCNYGIDFAAAFQHENFYAVQFHPEKSGAIGERILENFLNL